VIEFVTSCVPRADLLIEGRYLRLYFIFLNPFNILLIKLNEACVVEDEVLKPNSSVARILLVTR
jgi:hypothetical protein